MNRWKPTSAKSKMMTPCLARGAIFYFSAQLLQSFFCSLFLQLTFPQNDDIPPKAFELFVVFFVSLHIPINLSVPVFLIRSRPDKSSAVVMMPEAPVNKHNSAIFRENDIGPPRKHLYIKSVTKSMGEQILPDHQFRFRIGAPDVRHILMPNLRSVIISHD